MKYIGTILQTLRDEELINRENNIRGYNSSILVDRYIKLDENEKTMYIDANIPYGWAVS